MTKTIIWLTKKLILATHQMQLAEHGGGDGIRDEGLLESALQRSENAHYYNSPKPDLASLAANYAYGIIKNHPFIDGNKRTAWVACRLFLKINGEDIIADEVDKYKVAIQLADGSISEDEFAQWIRDNQ